MADIKIELPPMPAVANFMIGFGGDSTYLRIAHRDALQVWKEVCLAVVAVLKGSN